MSRRNVFFSGYLSSGETIELDAAESRHLVKVLRARQGDEVGVLNGRGTMSTATVEEIEDSRRGCRCRCRIGTVRDVSPLPLQVHLKVAPPRPKHMDSIIETASALGVASITPVFCERSVRLPSRVDHWETAAITALKQSGNPFLPDIGGEVEFSVALENSLEHGYFGDIFLENQKSVLEPVPGSGELELWIGPEGGFSDAEKSALVAQGIQPLCVGQWTLRVEVAVPVLLGALFGGKTAAS